MQLHRLGFRFSAVTNLLNDQNYGNTRFFYAEHISQENDVIKVKTVSIIKEIYGALK